MYFNDEFFNKNINIKYKNNKYYLKDYIKDKNLVSTKIIQDLIDNISLVGGTLVVDDNYITGALYLKNNVDLEILNNSSLNGSINIFDYPLTNTRIEGECCIYFPALINLIDVNNINIYGDGLINGCGLTFWRKFWLRRSWNKSCTNKDEERPRLIFVSNSNNINIFNLTIKDSAFWTIHLYKSEYIKLFNLNITSPKEPVMAPSTDAIDIDASRYIHIYNNYISCNDDGIALKGGKGINAHTDINNGINEYILIEDIKFGFCHSVLTCGSESIHNKNILVRNIAVDDAKNILWLKMRSDTLQLYEDIIMDGIKGNSKIFLNINSWNQFKNSDDILFSKAINISFNNIDIKCVNAFFITEKLNEYKISDFSFNNVKIECQKIGYDYNKIENVKFNNLKIIN